MGTEQTTEIETMMMAGKPGFYKSVPPEVASTPGTGGGFYPGIISSQPGNLLDGCIDKKYQLSNSFQEGCFLGGGGTEPLREALSPDLLSYSTHIPQPIKIICIFTRHC
jgi:hypothetical protein